MTDADTITVVVWNIEADGGPNGERRTPALDVLAGLEPDVVLQQEAKYSRAHGERLMRAAEKRLALRGFLSEPNPDLDTDIATAVYVNPYLFHVAERRPVRKPWYLHPCHVQTYLGDCPVPLNLASFHLCFFDANQRLTEASWLTRLAGPGMVTLAAGDTNSYPRLPETVTLPDWTTVTDHAHMVHRTYLEHGSRHTDIRPDGTLIDADYVDLARHAADHIRGISGEAALAPTAGFNKPGQGGPQRIDRGYAFGGAESALIHVEVIDTNETREASDHALLLYRFSRSSLERQLTRDQVALCC
ncbi:endonuclease/exonuclease/phosphatase family protein [Streptomyces shenzhenensis]|uniref:endonuclease/exonuclease/phosphatase family protein n=1 Tax=Streptomyces shenzhenensis TaxID=943815 RepID=UPI00381FA54C